MRFLLASVVAIALFAIGGPRPTHAALVTCDPSFTADGTSKVYNGSQTAVSDCQYLVPPDNSNAASVANINAAGFFGFSDWTLNGSNLQVQVNSGGNGTWTITDAGFATHDYLIAFKDGKGTNLIAFLFNEEFETGYWDTPFTEPPFDFTGGATEHDVSHYTIVQRHTTINVPEPATLALLGLGLLGLALMRRRA